ncbi:hypothetical protein SNEBB_006160, partial [Seison nebaliae]
LLNYTYSNFPSGRIDQIGEKAGGYHHLENVTEVGDTLDSRVLFLW